MKYWYAFRNGWPGSNIYIAELDEDFKPTERWAKLDLGKRGCRVGREDVRLFRLNGKLHASFVGYTGKATNVLFARINEESLKVEDVFYPQIPGRRKWEKNHSYFDYQGIAHAVYETNPNHRILKIEGDKAEWAYETPFLGQWSGGHMRGGASPVLHNGAWYHFFHGAVDKPGRKRLYNIGITVFRAEPPFDILRYTPHPIDVADPSVTPPNIKVDVIFPCGAIRHGDGWAISMGVADQWSEIRFYSDELIESSLVEHAQTHKPFSIISNNCWSNKVYEHLNLPYSTPFINLFIQADDYLRLLKRLRWYLARPVTFIKESRHAIVNERRVKGHHTYPIALLEDVELHGLHYNSEAEFLETWNRRLQRLLATDESRWFYKFSDDTDATPEQLAEFDALPFANKVCLQGTFEEQTDWKKFDAIKWVS